MARTHSTHDAPTSWLPGPQNSFCLSNPDFELALPSDDKVPELCHPDPLPVMRSPAVHRWLDPLIYRLLGQRARATWRGETSTIETSLNTLTHRPNPATEEQAIRYWVLASLARYHQPSLSSPGIAWHRTSRQPSWRPLAAIAFTPTCSCPDTPCRRMMLVGNWNDSLERPCGCWPLSLRHAQRAQAPVEP